MVLLQLVLRVVDECLHVVGACLHVRRFAAVVLPLAQFVVGHGVALLGVSLVCQASAYSIAHSISLCALPMRLAGLARPDSLASLCAFSTRRVLHTWLRRLCAVVASGGPGAAAAVRSCRGLGVDQSHLLGLLGLLVC